MTINLTLQCWMRKMLQLDPSARSTSDSHIHTDFAQVGRVIYSRKDVPSAKCLRRVLADLLCVLKQCLNCLDVCYPTDSMMRRSTTATKFSRKRAGIRSKVVSLSSAFRESKMNSKHAGHGSYPEAARKVTGATFGGR